VSRGGIVSRAELAELVSPTGPGAAIAALFNFRVCTPKAELGQSPQPQKKADTAACEPRQTLGHSGQ
jgi:hypothetical protein